MPLQISIIVSGGKEASSGVRRRNFQLFHRCLGLGRQSMSDVVARDGTSDWDLNLSQEAALVTKISRGLSRDESEMLCDH